MQDRTIPDVLARARARMAAHLIVMEGLGQRFPATPELLERCDPEDAETLRRLYTLPYYTPDDAISQHFSYISVLQDDGYTERMETEFARALVKALKYDSENAPLYQRAAGQYYTSLSQI